MPQHRSQPIQTEYDSFRIRRTRGEISGARIGALSTLWFLSDGLASKIEHVTPLANPTALTVGSVALTAVAISSNILRTPGIERKYKKLQSEGVDFAALNNSKKDRMQKRGRQLAGIVLSLGAIGGLTAAFPTNPVAPSVITLTDIGKLHKPVFDPTSNNTSFDDYVECGINLNTNHLYSSDYVYPSRPTIYKLFPHGKTTQNYVSIGEDTVYPGPEGGATTIRLDAFDISVTGNEIDVFQVTDTNFKEGEPSNWTNLVPYNGKNSPSGGWVIDKKYSLSGNLGIGTYDIFSYDNTDYIALSCNSSVMSEAYPALKQ